MQAMRRRFACAGAAGVATHLCYYHYCDAGFKVPVSSPVSITDVKSSKGVACAEKSGLFGGIRVRREHRFARSMVFLYCSRPRVLCPDLRLAVQLRCSGKSNRCSKRARCESSKSSQQHRGTKFGSSRGNFTWARLMRRRSKRRLPK